MQNATLGKMKFDIKIADEIKLLICTFVALHVFVESLAGLACKSFEAVEELRGA